jgi:hypothetical protein
MLGFLLSPLRRLLDLARGRGGDAVFRYHDGRRTVAADPLALKAGLDRACPEWARQAEELLAAEKVAAAGLDMGPQVAADLDRRRAALAADLIRATRAAFGLAEYAAGGRTDLGCLSVLAEYLAWVAGAMEDSRPLPTGVPPAAWAAPPSPPASGSDSPSTPPASGPSSPS